MPNLEQHTPVQPLVSQNWIYMWIRNVVEARFTGDLLVGLVTNLYEQQIRRRSKLCELEPHTIKVSILVKVDGNLWRQELTFTYTNLCGEKPNKFMLFDYKPRGIYTGKFGIVCWLSCCDAVIFRTSGRSVGYHDRSIVYNQHYNCYMMSVDYASTAWPSRCMPRRVLAIAEGESLANYLNYQRSSSVIR